MPLASGDTGTSQTMGAIRRLVDQSIKDPSVNQTAIQVTWNTPQFSDEIAKAQAVWSFVANPQNFRFVADMVGKETLRSARQMLQQRAGDCDDFTILIASLLGTIGIRTRARTIASHSDNPQEFSHIYPEAFCDGQWIAMDVARPDAAFGRAPERTYRDRAWDLFTPNFLDMKGLSGYCFSNGPSGMGRGKRGLGDDSDVTSVFNPSDIAAVTSGVANDIIAARASSANLYGVANPSANTLTPSAGAVIPGASILSSGTGLLLILGLGVIVVLAAVKK